MHCFRTYSTKFTHLFQVLHAYHDNYDFIMEMQIIMIDYDKQNFANYFFSYSHCRNPGSPPDAST